MLRVKWNKISITHHPVHCLMRTVTWLADRVRHARLAILPWECIPRFFVGLVHTHERCGGVGRTASKRSLGLHQERRNALVCMHSYFYALPTTTDARPRVECLCYYTCHVSRVMSQQHSFIVKFKMASVVGENDVLYM